MSSALAAYLGAIAGIILVTLINIYRTFISNGDDHDSTKDS